MSWNVCISFFHRVESLKKKTTRAVQLFAPCAVKYLVDGCLCFLVWKRCTLCVNQNRSGLFMKLKNWFMQPFSELVCHLCRVRRAKRVNHSHFQLLRWISSVAHLDTFTEFPGMHWFYINFYANSFSGYLVHPDLLNNNQAKIWQATLLNSTSNGCKYDASCSKYFTPGDGNICNFNWCNIWGLFKWSYHIYLHCWS